MKVFFIILHLNFTCCSTHDKPQYFCPPSPSHVSILPPHLLSFWVFLSVSVGIFLFSVFGFTLSLSPVSRQWFYPMVGDIMLFYHRVEPRTGCWEVSASVSPSVSPYTLPHPVHVNGWAGALGALGAAAGGGPSFSLTCILPHCAFFKSAMFHSLLMLCVLLLCNSCVKFIYFQMKLVKPLFINSKQNLSLRDRLTD